jgi:hypothetical protein
MKQDVLTGSMFEALNRDSHIALYTSTRANQSGMNPAHHRTDRPDDEIESGTEAMSKVTRIMWGRPHQQNPVEARQVSRLGPCRSGHCR